MKITVLDMDTAAIGGDISLDALAELGELKVVGETDLSRTASLIGDAQAAIINKSRITRGVMEQCPHLQYIGLMGTGFDQVDIASARERGLRSAMCRIIRPTRWRSTLLR